LASPAAGTERLGNLLALEKERLEAARVVVWVTTVRGFRFGSDWPPLELPEPGGGPEHADPPPRGRVVARVVAASETPERADYADCLMIVRYRTLGEPARTFDVAHLGWRDFAPTRAAELGPGDVVELQLAPLPPEQRLDRVCWQDGVGLARQPLWAASWRRTRAGPEHGEEVETDGNP
ncbi:MAG: hypothetical protein MI919_07770, partial [Holophagales bacterium]|nr:hypothetical protein [Holophagales bacterium]